MQIFFRRSRWTASGNGMGGTGPRTPPINRPGGAPRGRRPYLGRPAFRNVLDLDDGRSAVHLAREAIARQFGSDPPRDPSAPFRDRSLPRSFDEPRGVFVTLASHPRHNLRGCIGFPLAIYPLRAAIPRVAVAAAFEDPRFPPVGTDELPRIVVEVSVLTTPERIAVARPVDRVAAVDVGRHGLIVRDRERSGLLLPQVAVDWGWDAERFLAEACRKAGLAPDAWERTATVVERLN